MIERLNQITLNDFIELSCGNYACLLSGRGSVSESMLKEMASKLIIEYRSIVCIVKNPRMGRTSALSIRGF